MSQNIFKFRLFKAMKVVAWTIIFIVLYQTVHIINDGKVIANWWIGLMGMIIFLMLYLIPSERFIFRQFRMVYFGLFGFFLGWFLADIGEFLNTIKYLMQTQL